MPTSIIGARPKRKTQARKLAGLCVVVPLWRSVRRDGAESMTTASPPPVTSRRPWLGPLVVFALSCGVFWLGSLAITQPPAWRTFEFCQYAEIGRNLAEEGAV